MGFQFWSLNALSSVHVLEFMGMSNKLQLGVLSAGWQSSSLSTHSIEHFSNRQFLYAVKCGIFYLTMLNVLRAGAGQIKRVTVSGYPASFERRCHYDGTTQWTSPGDLKCKQDSKSFYNTDFDSCAGGSGSVVYEISTKKAIGIYVAETAYLDGECATNFVTRILDNAAGGVNPGLGVSLRALIRRVPAW